MAEATWQDAVVEALKLTDDNRIEMQARVTIVPSNTDERAFHYVMEFGKFEGRGPGLPRDEPVVFKSHDVVACTCRSFRFRDTCRHVKQVKGETDG